jgi:hypothetical protein
VYEALAVALEQSNGAADDIRRARLSAIALNPRDARGFLDAAAALGKLSEWDRALAFCQQAALLEPNSADAYAAALAYAEQGRDPAAMEWALQRLLSQDWPVKNRDIHLQAQTRAEAFAHVLAGENRADDADKLRAALRRLQQRDLVIQLTWDNGAQPCEVDLTVKEPSGGVASFDQRQTAGGGTFLANNLLQMNRVAYTASQAFSGEYEITVQRNWGQPSGNSARLEITHHAGTSKETKRVEVLSLERPRTLKSKLEDGRRHTLASVPPASHWQTVQEPLPAEDSSKVMSKLRELAFPEFAGVQADSAPRMEGRSGTPGAQPAAAALNRNQPERVAGQLTMTSPGGFGWNARAGLSADGRYLRLSINPVFEGVNAPPALDLSPIPGGLAP